MFTPLNQAEIKKIVRLQFEQVKSMLAENNISLELSEQAADWLSKAGYDPQFGARPVKRVLQKEVLNQLSKKILAGEILPEQKILVDKQDDTIKFKNI